MSGKESSFGLWQLRLDGPALLTGGQFGVDLSAISMALLGVVILAAIRFKPG